MQDTGRNNVMASVHHLRDVPISDDYVPSAAFKTPLTLASSPHPGIMELDDSKAHTSSPQIPIEDEKLDHRRRRRNRMRASCLNCYASKRKCDKRRPCGRCMRLGTTGLCIYEVEDTGTSSMNEADVNELKRLRRRIAELESVIRELKNNPHPRWTAPGGIEHDLGFFDSYRRSSQQENVTESHSPSGDSIHGVASVGFMVKTEGAASCAQEVEGSSKRSTQGVPRGSSQAPPPYSFRPASPVSFDSPSSNSASRMSQIAAPIDSASACNYSVADSSGSMPSLHGPRFSDRVSNFNDGVEVAMSSSLSLTHKSQFPDKCLDPCNCLKTPLAFGPLVHLGIALRRSREALEHLHPLSSNCVLYCRIMVLEQHIFSVPPQKQDSKSNPSPIPCMDSCPPGTYPATFSHSHSKDGHESPLPPLLHQSMPTSPSTHHYPHMFLRSPEPFAYMSDASAYRSLHRQ